MSSFVTALFKYEEEAYAVLEFADKDHLVLVDKVAVFTRLSGYARSLLASLALLSFMIVTELRRRIA